MSKAQSSAPAPAPTKGKGGSSTSKGKGAGPVAQPPGGSNQSDQQINDMLQHMASGMSWDQLMVDNQIRNEGRRRSARGKKKKKKFKGSVGNSINPDVPTTTPA